MKIGAEIYALVDPETDEVLGNGECLALYQSKPDQDEIYFVNRICQRNSKLVACKIVAIETP